ncbi:MAG: tRNA pseudouridine(13) synthase TruD [Nanoarchaeota archaeon]|nr:tRNA pseudouridine(13) synthase TruD [Nanoarchaeota archaeon]
MYKIKEKPEDFIVKETIKLNKKKNGEYGYFLLRKKDWNTLDVLKKISKYLKIKENRLGYAGLKDKVAVTEQYISIRGIKNLKFKLKDIEIKKIGEGDEPIKLGGLKGNKFNIIVRNLNNKKKLKITKIENYFDKQRFGNKNIKVGLALLKRDYKKLCGLLKVKNKEEVFRFDRKILRFSLNSYQSYIFNEALEECIKKKIKVKKLPLIHFDTEFKNKIIENIYQKLLKKDKIGRKDFLFREMPFLVSESVDRNTFTKVMDFKYRYGKDELNKRKLKAVLSFYLDKGSYGTLVVKKLFS